jgi:hypothetical protein
MHQIEEGELPFNRLPTAANDVQVFPSMQSPLLIGCGIWFDNENGSVVNGATKDKIRAIIATSGDDLLLAAPFDNQSLTWKTAPTAPGPRVNPVQSVPLNLAQDIQNMVCRECQRVHTMEFCTEKMEKATKLSIACKNPVCRKCGQWSVMEPSTVKLDDLTAFKLLRR